MAEYIDRKAAISAAIDGADMWAGGYSATRDIAISEELKKVPAADVVEVVRCGECKYRRDDNFCGGRGWPEQLVPDDGYCDKGAKKEGRS